MAIVTTSHAAGRRPAALILAWASAVSAFAQAVVPAPLPASTGSVEEPPVMLTPFEVTSSSDMGYEARETLSGSRLNTSLKDVASQVQVMTSEFLQDLAITDLNEAIAYSMNMESASEFFDVSNTNNAGNEGSIQAFSGSPRSRGLGGVVIGGDFFQRVLAPDTYNIERLTFAPGASNTLFGNATPAGSIDATTKRAVLHQRRGSISYRFDDRGGDRATWDFNLPVVPKKAALRWVGLRERTNEWREPSFADQDRQFLAATITPHKRISVRAWYEQYEAKNQPVRNTLLRDRVSPWIAAGRPAFDNSRTLAGVAANRTYSPSPTHGGTGPWVRSPAARTNPYYVLNAGQGGGIVRLVNTAAGQANFGTVNTVGEGTLGTAPNNFDWSLTDAGIEPIDVAFGGNAVQAHRHDRNRGVVANVNPIDNLYIELGQSRELFKHRFVDLFRFSELNLYADANRWAVDQTGALRRDNAGGLVPNPYFGRYYMESAFLWAGTTLQELDQRRASAAYQLDLTKRNGWQKWLGRHNFTGMYDRLIQWQTGAGQRHDPTAVTPVSGGPAGTASAVFMRYYLPEPQSGGSYAVNLPFDPMQAGVIELPNSGGVQLRGYDSPQGATGTPGAAQRNIHSRAFAVQSYLWQDRIVLGYSRRTDRVESYSLGSFTWPRNETGGLKYLDQVWDEVRGAPREQASAGEKTKANKSVVVHPWRWLSAHYAELANAQVTGLTRYSYDSSEIDLGTGRGKEYGITLRSPGDRVSIRFNKYVSTLVGATGSTLGTANNIAEASGGGGNFIRIDVPAIEQAALQAGAPIDPKWQAFQQELLLVPFVVGNNVSNANTRIVGNSTIRDTFDFVVDRESRGYEVTIVGNPTPGWRVSVSGAQNVSAETNLAPSIFAFINDRLPVWANYAANPNVVTWRDAGSSGTPGPGANPAINPSDGVQTLAELLQGSIANFQYIERSAGQPNVMDRKYRVTASTSYGFQEGWLKGVRTGLTFRWRSPAAIGFRPVTVSDNRFVVPGLTAPTLEISDPSNPIRGSGITEIDGQIAYQRRLFRKVTWSVQLNVRNVLDQRDLLAQRALNTGEPVVFSLQAPRTFILTNTFSF